MFPALCFYLSFIFIFILFCFLVRSSVFAF